MWSFSGIMFGRIDRRGEGMFNHFEPRKAGQDRVARYPGAGARCCLVLPGILRTLRAPFMPPIRYPADLPVSQRRDDILVALRAHQVVIIAGETGSGKTTQLPKMCLEAGFAERGM